MAFGGGRETGGRRHKQNQALADRNGSTTCTQNAASGSCGLRKRCGTRPLAPVTEDGWLAYPMAYERRASGNEAWDEVSLYGWRYVIMTHVVCFGGYYNTRDVFSCVWFLFLFLFSRCHPSVQRVPPPMLPVPRCMHPGTWFKFCVRSTRCSRVRRA